MVTLDAGTTALVYTEEDLARLQSIIQNSDATPEDLLLALRKLSCHEISLQELQETVPLLQPSVQVHTVEHLLRAQLLLAYTRWCMVTSDLQELSHTGGAMQMLEYHQNCDVARIAGRLVRHIIIVQTACIACMTI